MDIKQLENLIALVEEGSVGQAALRQHISQPGLSMSIKRLEEDLKITLFRKEGRRIRPTDSCLEFYERAKLALAQLRIGRADLPGAESISLRFGIGETRDAHFIGNLTAGLIDRFPGIRLEFFEQRYSQLLPRVANGEIDAAFFGAPRNSIPRSLQFISLHTTRLCVACRANHPLTHRKRALTDHELLKANWVTSRRWPAHLISRDGQPFNVPITVDSLQAVRQILRSVDCLTVLPEEVIERELSEGSLVKLSSRRFSYEIEILAVRRRNFPSRILDAAFEIARSAVE